MSDGNGNERINGTQPTVSRGGPNLGPGLEDRLPPQNPEAERSLLGSVLIGTERDLMSDLVDSLHVSDFYSDAHQTIYQAMIDLYEQGKPREQIAREEEGAEDDE